MSAPERPLLLLGRSFDGFDRALSRQLAQASRRAVHRLPDILDLQERVVAGDAAVSGEADLLLVVTDWLPALIAEGKVLPLDDYFDGTPPDGWPDVWHPALRDLQRGPDGRTYGVPYHVGPEMLLYRSDLYDDPAERAGFAERFGYPLAAPDTWEQYTDQARWFTRPGDGLHGTIVAGYPDEHNTVYDFLTQLWSRGAELTDSEGRLSLDSAEALDSARFLYDLWHTHRVVDPAAAEWDSVASGVHFAAGEAAMMVNWSGFAALSAPEDSPIHGRVRCAPVPRADVPGGGRVALNSYWVLAVAAGSTRPDDAYAVLRDLTTAAMDRVTAEEGGTATRRDSWADPAVARLAPYYALFEEAHENTRALPRDPRWPRISVILDSMVASLVAGTAKPDEAIALAHRKLAELG
ncbi:extracellular solute-binding protein [Streptomyces sp. 150FB]|uniref:extracellular solute-binding protein n=1 Tax=Streptomyces sp. 150FB TaxID=1576605 RepID=UPI000695E2B5|nr:extracellular solute-binding protein [Streptomyces sp. 150FB]